MLKLEYSATVILVLFTVANIAGFVKQQLGGAGNFTSSTVVVGRQQQANATTAANNNATLARVQKRTNSGSERDNNNSTSDNIVDDHNEERKDENQEQQQRRPRQGEESSTQQQAREHQPIAPRPPQPNRTRTTTATTTSTTTTTATTTTARIGNDDDDLPPPSSSSPLPSSINTTNERRSAPQQSRPPDHPIAPPPEPPAPKPTTTTTTAAITTTTKAIIQGNDDDDLLPPSPSPPPMPPSSSSNDTTASSNNNSGRFDLCFVASGFWPDASMADRLPDMTNLAAAYPRYGFFFFTNLKDLESPGWTKLVRQDLPYTRYITHSRWGKFMGWQDPHLNSTTCKVIFYMDIYLMPAFSGDEFDVMAADVLDNPSAGLMQSAHTFSPDGPLGEFRAILRGRKDVRPNVRKSIQWLRAQPGFNDEQCCRMYQNSAFGYDPSNAVYRRISQFFWDRYSLEVDSWRDQPLWSYTLYRFNITPISFPKPFVELFPPDFKRHNRKFHRVH